MSFAQNLRILRKEARLLQGEVAVHLGVSKQAYSKWETGASEPGIESIVKLCDFFQVSADYLLGRVDDPSAINTQDTAPLTDDEVLILRHIIVDYLNTKDLTKYLDCLSASKAALECRARKIRTATPEPQH